MMPIRQQYFIAAAIIGLIAVMVLFAIFDYTSDRSRFADQMAMQPQGRVAFAGAMPSVAPTNFNSPGTYQCLGCGWQGVCPANRRCPNCFGTLGNRVADLSPVTAQTVAFGMRQCSGCGWRGMCPANGRCRNCLALLGAWGAGPAAVAGQTAAFGMRQCSGCGWRGVCPADERCPNCLVLLGAWGAGPAAATAQNAGFWTFQQPQPETPARPRGMLQCPGCAFAMSSKHSVTPNSIRCPRCPAYLIGWDQFAAGSAGLGQQAAFVPGVGQGLGQGLNPYCPLR